MKKLKIWQKKIDTGKKYIDSIILDAKKKKDNIKQLKKQIAELSNVNKENIIEIRKLNENIGKQNNIDKDKNKQILNSNNKDIEVIQTKDKNNDEFKCETCMNSFINIQALNKHIETKHLEEKCINCNKSFNKTDLFNQISMKECIKTTCNECGMILENNKI